MGVHYADCFRRCRRNGALQSLDVRPGVATASEHRAPLIFLTFAALRAWSWSSVPRTSARRAMDQVDVLGGTQADGPSPFLALMRPAVLRRWSRGCRASRDRRANPPPHGLCYPRSGAVPCSPSRRPDRSSGPPPAAGVAGTSSRSSGTPPSPVRSARARDARQVASRAGVLRGRSPDPVR